MKRIKYPTPVLLDYWKKNFEREMAKFIKSTHLQLEDYMGEFQDSDGESWKILGVIDNKEMACEKISSSEVFIWDRWRVSQLKRPDEHKKADKKIEYVVPDKRKKRSSKKDAPVGGSQLSLFNEQ